jgi:hypothetical protein
LIKLMNRSWLRPNMEVAYVGTNTIRIQAATGRLALRKPDSYIMEQLFSMFPSTMDLFEATEQELAASIKGAYGIQRRDKMSPRCCSPDH